MTTIEPFRAPDRAAMERNARIDRKIAEAYNIVADAIEEHITKPGKRLAGECVLFSGGDDSNVLAHLFRDADWFVHINTGICVLDEDADDEVSAAAQYVRSIAARYDVPLIEEHGDDYDALVIEHGFPGPAHHFKMYQRLKERGLRKVRKRLVVNGRKERVLFIAGRRRQESERRKAIPEHEREGSVVWASPFVNWSKQDLNDYRTIYNVPRNPVSVEMHMSGECLCGAFAKAGELEELAFWRPRTAARIKALEEKVTEAGNCPPERCQWGWGAYRASKKQEPKWVTITRRWCRTCGPGSDTLDDDHQDWGGHIDHDYDEVTEEHQEWREPPPQPKLGPLCSQCSFFDPEPGAEGDAT